MELGSSVRRRERSGRGSGLKLAWLLVWLMLSGWVAECLARGSDGSGRLVYGGAELLQLRGNEATPSPDLLTQVPGELLRPHHAGRARKRGKKGGVRQRTRKAKKLPLPPILLCNARSLRYKMDKLRTQVGVSYEYRESGLLVFTETWFVKDLADSFVQVEGFSHIRSDREDSSEKRRGGGLCVYVKDSWCRNFAVRDNICNPDLELLCVTLRPYYLPREFSNIFLCVVYVPPDARAANTASQIADCVHRHLQNKPDAPMLVLGDLNHCPLEKYLPGFQQYVRCATRNNNTLDKCFGNIKGAYTARAKAPLTTSCDHMAVHLTPTYRSVFKTCKPITKTTHVWSEDAVEQLKGCFLCTDWDVFFHDANINVATETITDYITFCVDSIIPQKTITKYPNNKPYVTKEIKECIRRRRTAFRAGDTAAMKAAERDLEQQMRESRRQRKVRAEQELANSNIKRLWNSIRKMTNMEPTRKPMVAQNECTKANELNDFFMRFETDSVDKCYDVLNALPYSGVDDRIIIDPGSVTKVFKSMNTNKATGPDGMGAFLLKTCAEELTPAWHRLFQVSIDTHTVPDLWKKSIIVPVPKMSCPLVNNDYRPVALTSNVVKSLERIITEELRKETEASLDPYQFAYAKNRGTSDAISTLTHRVLKHLEDAKTYARLLFVDFSSAFNTIHPDILLRGLARLRVNPFLIRWYFSFLSKRPQQVRFNSVLSDKAVSSTGAPQGTVSSSLLFTLYTNECVSSQANQYVIKFSDDTVILSLLTSEDNISSHTTGVDRFVRWCDEHHLQINVKKTQEIVVDPRSVGDHTPITVHGHDIKQVDSYKYLGVQIDCQMNWHSHVTCLCSKIHQRLHFLRRLRLFGVCRNIMLIFYRASIESIVRYGITSWFGNLSVKYKSEVFRLVKTAGKVMGMSAPPITPQVLFDESAIGQAKKIVSDPSHILHREYRLLPSGMRYETHKWHYNRYKYSFIPLSITLLNVSLAEGRQRGRRARRM